MTPQIVKDVVKVGGELNLALVPVMYEGLPIDKVQIRKQFPQPSIPAIGYTAMSFMVPGRESKTAVDSRRSEDFDKNADVVRVYLIRPRITDIHGRPETGKDVRQLWKSREAFAEKNRLTAHDYLGMTCYRYEPIAARRGLIECLTKTEDDQWAIVSIDEAPVGKPILPEPMFDIQYSTKKYGGLDVKWRVHAKHADAWREIEKKLWILIEERHVSY